MKYRQHGGGKIPQKVKFAYLRHCQRLIDNNNDVVSKNYLLLALKNYSVNNIMQLYQHEFIEQIIGDFRKIWDSIEQSDRNYLRMVNVVSFQLSALFTYACLDFREPTLEDFNNSERQLSYFKEFTNEIKYKDLPENSSHDWRNYKHVKKHGRLLKKLSASESENTSNGIITILDYLTLDDIIKPYLNGWFICGLVYTKTYADNKEMLPFAFIEHDIVHYYNYTYTCFTRAGAELPVLLQLYRFINRIHDKKRQYSAKLLFFIIIHEGLCQWDDAGFLREGNILNSSSRFYSSAVQQERFIDDTDLGLLIPKTERNGSSRRLTYLERALTIYRETLGQFKELDNSFMDEPFVAFPDEGDTNEMDAFGPSAEELFASMDASRHRDSIKSESVKSDSEPEDDFNKCNKLYCENKIYNEQDYEDAIEKQGKYEHLQGNIIDKLLDTRDDCFQAYYRDWANGPASISDCRDESSSGSSGSSGSSISIDSLARGKKTRQSKSKRKKTRTVKKSKKRKNKKSKRMY